MTRGDVTHTKVHYKGSNENFVIFVDSVDDFKKWQGDKSIPIAQVVSSFKVFTTHGYVCCLPFRFHSPLTTPISKYSLC